MLYGEDLPPSGRKERVVLMRNRHAILPASVMALSLALFAHRLWEGYRWGHFLEGLLTGLAFSLAVFCLITQFRDARL
jgi:hypothetical protein